ncbi:hypothetical protein CPter291_2767 [Collimonas pratensis]|uniref:Uncharacterized protein n=1 Tax=Collimonas pratensis TaxID=279113 RepID=A0A127QZA2_9BURK|nr:hypothetical protein CPter91_2579 [Collimonas pratensis]AMP15022.1 hypothetical protein CPter291_2767 [Collimonas pratensis]
MHNLDRRQGMARKTTPESGIAPIVRIAAIRQLSQQIKI